MLRSAAISIPKLLRAYSKKNRCATGRITTSPDNGGPICRFVIQKKCTGTVKLLQSKQDKPLANQCRVNANLNQCKCG